MAPLGRLKRIGGGLMSLALGVGSLIACGLPDATPVVETLQDQARAHGLEQRIDYRTQASGVLGAYPTAVSAWEDATREDVRAMVALLQENTEATREAGFRNFRFHVNLYVDQTRLELRHAPSDELAGVLIDLIAPGVARVSAATPGHLDVAAEETAHGHMVAMAERVGESIVSSREKAGLSTASHLEVRTPGWSANLVLQATGQHPLTPEHFRRHLDLAAELQMAAEPMRLDRILVRAGQGMDLTIHHGLFDPALFTTLAETAPAGTALIVHAQTGSALHAVIGGTSPEPPRNTAEEGLREVVEKPV
ncbi:hypothetical protein EAH68_04625 [Corynebacterium hylobatis]|uniref:Lipoprotein n=1 Tax=Corynebacterium hylobatis TaxID=1859290 RepID=A0A430HZE7_9CORY|nr:hypothetical protein [Corynebacterium hylobatis]RSZ64291.1 hypothetical protein EAH68_04625 [Corynebacterium hylobatis]